MSVLGWQDLVDDWYPTPPGDMPTPVWVSPTVVRAFWIANLEDGVFALYYQDSVAAGDGIVDRQLSGGLDVGHESIGDIETTLDLSNPGIGRFSRHPDGHVLLELEYAGGGAS